MGYNTEFVGAIQVRPALFTDFIERWGAALIAASPIRTPEAAEQDLLPGIEHDGKPRSWCPWIIGRWSSADGDQRTLIEHDGGEKAEDYEQWLQVLVDVIRREFPAAEFEGCIDWFGEDREDLGRLEVGADGKVTAKLGQIVYS